MSDVQGWVREVAYKPNWRFDLEETSDGSLLCAECSVENSRRPGSHSTITGKIPVAAEAARSEQLFRLQVRELVRRMEFHEVGEWLTFGGERVFDPHAEPPPPA